MKGYLAHFFEMMISNSNKKNLWISDFVTRISAFSKAYSFSHFLYHSFSGKKVLIRLIPSKLLGKLRIDNNTGGTKE